MKLSSLSPSALWRSLKPAIVRNIGLKIVSLSCAIALFVFVHGAQNAQRHMAVGLLVLLPPASHNKTLTTDLPASVHVTLHGPRSIVEDLRASELSLQLDLRSGVSGVVPLEGRMLRVPGGVYVDAIQPSTLNISWDDEVERVLQVQVVVTGSPSDGFMVKGKPEVVPETVVARGPGLVVGSLHSVLAETFDITGVGEGVHRQNLVIEHPPPRVSYDTVHATASIEIIRKLQERLFSNIAVQVVGVPKATTVPSYIDVRVRGAQSLVESLRVEQIVPHASVTEAEASKKANSVLLPVEFQIDDVELTMVPSEIVVKW